MTTVSSPGDEQVGAGVVAEPKTGAPATPRDLLARPSVQGLLAFLLYAVVYLSTAARPLIVHITSAQLDQHSPDPNFYVWAMQWWPYAIGHLTNPWYSHLIGAPAGDSLAWVTTAPPLALLASPITVLAGPVVTFNLVTALGLPLAAWAAFVLCRRLTGKFWPSVVGGAVFGFSAYEMNHGSAGQLNLTYSLLLPILAYLVVVWRDNGLRDRTFVILAGLLMAVQFYLFLETFADLTAVLVVGLAVGLVIAGPAVRPQVLRLTRLLAFAYAIAIVLAVPYLAYALTNKPPRLKANTSMDLASVFVPRPGRTFGIAWLAHIAAGPVTPSRACYVGIPLLALALLLALTRWSSRLVRFLTCMLVFIMVAALGSSLYFSGRSIEGLPWGKVWTLPLLRNAYPLRLMVFAFLVLAVATALFLAVADSAVKEGSLGSPATWGRWLLAVLVLLAIAEDTPSFNFAPQTNVPKFISAGDYRHDLRPGEIAVVVSNVGNAGMLWQAQSDYYWRLAGGFINAFITHRTDLPKPVQNLEHATPAYVAEFQQYVRKDHIGAVLLDVRHEPLWSVVFARMGLTGHRTGDVMIYQTNGCASCRALTQAQIAAPASTTT
jgi:hypothetical protein